MTRNITVLLADDDDVLRQMLSEAFKRSQITCIATESADHALQILHENDSIDVLVSDIVMQGNENLDAIKTINRLYPQLPVILITGQPTVDTAIESVRLSVTDYLVKPFQPSKLIDAIHRANRDDDMGVLFQNAQNNLQKWAEDVNSLHKNAVQNKLSSSDAFQTYMNLTLSNMAGCIADLHSASLDKRMEQAEGNDNSPCQYFNCTRYAKQIDIIKHTIQVLESTRQSFKSKELHKLRQRLQEELDSMLPVPTSSSPQ